MQDAQRPLHNKKYFAPRLGDILSASIHAASMLTLWLAGRVDFTELQLFTYVKQLDNLKEAVCISVAEAEAASAAEQETRSSGTAKPTNPQP